MAAPVIGARRLSQSRSRADGCGGRKSTAKDIDLKTLKPNSIGNAITLIAALGLVAGSMVVRGIES